MDRQNKNTLKNLTDLRINRDTVERMEASTLTAEMRRRINAFEMWGYREC